MSAQHCSLPHVSHLFLMLTLLYVLASKIPHSSPFFHFFNALSLQLLHLYASIFAYQRKMSLCLSLHSDPNTQPPNPRREKGRKKNPRSNGIIFFSSRLRAIEAEAPPFLPPASDPMAFMRTSSNASSGMGVAPDIRETFLELQMKKAFRYVIFKIEEKQKQVVVEKKGATTESYDDFLASLPENDCRYALYDFDFVTGENVQKSKIFFIAWSPATSRIRAKMLYSTSKDRIKHELDGFHYEIQATDPTEVELEVLRERAH